MLQKEALKDTEFPWTSEWEKESFKGMTLPSWLKRVAVGICKAYNITGICDAGYIANLIKNEISRVLEEK
jgi:hypothetical protein